MQLIKGKPRGKGLKFYSLYDPPSGYCMAAILHSRTYQPFEEVWGRIVATCYALLHGDSAKGLRSFLDQGYYVSSGTATYYKLILDTIRQSYSSGGINRLVQPT